MKSRWLRVRRGTLPLLVLSLAILLAACDGRRDTRFDAATAKTEPAVAKEAVHGSKFNAHFPKAEDNWDVVFTQEKEGMAQAELKKDNKAVAQLAVFDSVSNKEAA